MIYSAYIEEQSKLNDKELNIFKEDVNYYYQQGQEEVNKTLKKKKIVSVIPDAIFLALLDMSNSKGYTWNEYIEIIIKYNADQIYRQAIIDIQQQKELDIYSDIYQNLIKKQQNSKLNINEDKISGNVDLTLIGINNKAKIEGIYSFDDKAKVKFIGINDEKQTDMCKSLDGQKFYIHDWNEFERYSESNKRITKYKCYGLVIGLNCPPIDDNFHWCRSYIMYLPPVEKEEKIEYNIDNFLRIEDYNRIKHKNYELDYEIAATEYQQLPENVRKLLENNGIKFKFDYTRTSSGYDKDKKEILLIPDLVEGETTHEIGHAIFDIMNVKQMKEYNKIVTDIFKQAQGPDINSDRVEEYYYLKTSYNIDNEYQVFLGNKNNPQKVVYNITNNELPELFSEAYRIKHFNGNQSDELNKLVEEVENRC